MKNLRRLKNVFFIVEEIMSFHECLCARLDEQFARQFQRSAVVVQ